MPRYVVKRTARQKKLLFSSDCIVEVLPGVKEEQQTKAVLFEAAASWGVTREECPAALGTKSKLRRYIKNHWKIIRLIMPDRHGILPVYVNGTGFGGGGGYRKGDLKHAQKQVERDAKIVDGVVRAANDYAQVTVKVFPQVTAERRHTVVRRIAA